MFAILSFPTIHPVAALIPIPPSSIERKERFMYKYTFCGTHRLSDAVFLDVFDPDTVSFACSFSKFLVDHMSYLREDSWNVDDYLLSRANLAISLFANSLREHICDSNTVNVCDILFYNQSLNFINHQILALL